MIDHRSRFRKNDVLPLWRRKEKAAIINACALITRKIMRSKDAQCNTGNDVSIELSHK